MAKNKISWVLPKDHSENAIKSVFENLNLIQQTTALNAKELSSLFVYLDSLYEFIVPIQDVSVQLRMIEEVLQTDLVLHFVEDLEFFEEFSELYVDFVDFFLDLASGFEDKDFLEEMLRNIAFAKDGADPKSFLFLSVQEFLPKEKAFHILNDILEKYEQMKAYPSEFTFEAAKALTDGLNAPDYYEKLCFSVDKNKSIPSLLNVANAYYDVGDIPNTKRILSEIQGPIDALYEEDYLDLQVGIASQEGKQKEALALAKTLYQKYPKELNLGRLCQLVSPEEAQNLLRQHEKSYLDDSVCENYLSLLIGLEEFDLANEYLDQNEESLAGIEAQILFNIVERLESIGQIELAKRIEKWIVEEPEDLTSYD